MSGWTPLAHLPARRASDDLDAAAREAIDRTAAIDWTAPDAEARIEAASAALERVNALLEGAPPTGEAMRELARIIGDALGRARTLTHDALRSLGSEP